MIAGVMPAARSLGGFSGVRRSSGLMTSPDGVGGDARVERGGVELGVAQQNLDHADIDVLFEQVRCEAVPQRMRGHALVDLGHLGGGVAGAIELTRRHRIDRVLPGKQPALRPRDAPPVAQKLQQLRREHRVTILAALAVLDAQHHALAVDVRDLQRDDLGDAQAGAIGDAERGLVLDAGRRLQEARDLLGAQDDRQLARLMHDRQMPGRVGAIERHGEEEPQRRDGGVDERRAGAGLGQMQLETAQVLVGRRVRRPADEPCQVYNGANVVMLGLRREMADTSCPRSCAGEAG